MKYIAKAKGANRFKTYDSITAFDTKNFDDYELYEVKELNKEQYGEALRQQKINELQSQLSELGVDLSALVKPQQVVQPQPSQPITANEQSSESPLLEGDKVVSGKDMSKIKRKDGSFIAMEEVADSFYKLTGTLEKEVPEFSYGTFDETGITLMMTEKQPIRKMLPNGIPVKQVLG